MIEVRLYKADKNKFQHESTFECTLFDFIQLWRSFQIGPTNVRYDCFNDVFYFISMSRHFIVKQK